MLMIPVGDHHFWLRPQTWSSVGVAQKRRSDWSKRILCVFSIIW
jgi:hypothetical protein